MSALRLTAAIKLRMLNYLQRLILILPFDAPHADSFTSCMTPVETSTTPYWITVTQPVILILAFSIGIVNGIVKFF